MDPGAFRTALDDIRETLRGDFFAAIRRARNGAIISGLSHCGPVVGDLDAAAHNYIPDFLIDAFHRTEVAVVDLEREHGARVFMRDIK
jgi:hypothetical protein